MRKVIGYIIPFVLIVSLSSMALSAIYAQFKKSSNESIFIDTEQKISETKEGKANYVLKDPVEQLEQQSDEVNSSSETDESNKLEDIINVITENTEE